MRKKIMVTGGAGYIGSHTIRLLLEKGYDADQIIVFDNLSEGHLDAVPASVEFINGDLRNGSQIQEVFLINKISCVIHFAGSAYVDESIKNPGKYFDNNVSGGINLLNSMQIGGCKNLIFSSTCSIYGDSNKFPLNESTSIKIINPYAESKYFFERMLGWYKKTYGINSISLRYFNAAGAAYEIGERHDPETHLIPLLIKTALGKNPFFYLYEND
jgi:UDP-glucose 4-epimerase